MLSGSPGSNAFDSFKRFLAAYAEQNTVLSAEGIGSWVSSDSTRDGFLALLAEARQITPIRCIWTLRRLDEVTNSIFLLSLLRDVGTFRSARELGNSWPFTRLFAGMKDVEEAAHGNVTYIRYSSDGSHNRELLSSLGLHDQQQREIQDAMDGSPRVAVSLSQKQAVTLLNLDSLSRRAGVDLDGARLRVAFERGALAFAGDRPGQVLDAEARKEIHERALAAASGVGLAAYIEFFADEKVGAFEGVEPSPDMIDDDDLRRLIASSR